MLVKQMHIEFGLGFQKLGANSRRKFYPEQIDMLLSRAQDYFIADQIKDGEDREGFQAQQIDVDKLRPLIVRGVSINAEFQLSEPGKYHALLPGDYAYLINAKFANAKNCAAVTSSSIPRYYFTLPLVDSPLSASPYYAAVSIVQGAVTAVNLTTDISGYAGYGAKTDKFMISDLILETFYQKKRNGVLPATWDLYWEKMGDVYSPNSFILVSPANTNVSWTVDTTVSSVPVQTVNYTQKFYTGYTNVPARHVKASLLDNVVSIPFMNPLPGSPVMATIGNVLEVYAHPSYIVNTALVTYVRKAPKINLSLQHNCILAPEFHQLIVDKAIEYAASRVEQQALFQATAADNIRNQ